MRQIKVNIFVTLDGVVQSPGGPEEDITGGFKYGGWIAGSWDEMLGKILNEFMAVPFDILLGRKTYEIFASYWPYVENEIADKFNSVRKYVVSKTVNKLDWKNSTLISDNVIDEIRKLKEQPGPELQVYGSSNLIKTLVNANLADQIKVWTFPVAVGKGKQLFGEGTNAMSFKLADIKSSGTGVIVATYEPAGELKTSTVPSESVSDEEHERRRKQASENQ